MKLVMLATCASPEVVLHEGRAYDAPRALAKKLLAGGRMVSQTSDGTPVFSAAAEPFDPKKHGNLKVFKIPARPDPEDRPEMELDEEFEDIEDEDDGDEADAA